MYYIYILKSEKDSSYYVGSTKDLNQRVERHNAGRSRYTKNRGPWKLLYSEHYDTRAQAVQREKQIKGWKNKKCIQQLIASVCPEGRPD